MPAPKRLGVRYYCSNSPHSRRFVPNSTRGENFSRRTRDTSTTLAPRCVFGSRPCHFSIFSKTWNRGMDFLCLSPLASAFSVLVSDSQPELTPPELNPSASRARNSQRGGRRNFSRRHTHGTGALANGQAAILLSTRTLCIPPRPPHPVYRQKPEPHFLEICDRALGGAWAKKPLKRFGVSTSPD